MQPVLRPARMCDAKKIHGLLMECSAEGLLLPRSLSNLYGQIRDFRILETSGGEFIGCAALAVIWENLAEVRSLAIAKPWRGNGFGNILVDECCKDAQDRHRPGIRADVSGALFRAERLWRGEQGSVAPARLDRLCELPPFPRL